MPVPAVILAGQKLIFHYFTVNLATNSDCSCLSDTVLHNESEYVAAMQRGDKDAFTILYRHYSPRLYTGILRIVKDPLSAEEIIQELFTRVWMKRELPGLQENFTGYIYRIGQRLVFDFFRNLKKDRELLARFRKLAEEQYDPVEGELLRKESSKLLHRAIEQLSPQQQRVYQLVKVEGYTYKRTAEIMGISPLTVKEYLVTTKKALQHYMLNHMDHPLLIAGLLAGSISCL